MSAGWRHGVARGAYSLLLAALKPVYVLRLWWRGRAEPMYRHAIAERFGAYRGVASQGWVWVHAVSLGETRAASALIDELRRVRPGMKLLLTNGTATGRDAGAALLRDGDRQAWLPYDVPWVVRRFFAHFRPVVGVLMETEVWPNLLLAARAAHVPMALANARLSAKSRRRGERLDVLLRPSVESISLVLAQTEDDARRARDSGAPQVLVSGNLKFDMAPDAQLLARGRAWQAAVARRVVLAAIFREGEEAMLLDAWSALPVPRPLLIVVPRHPQRFDEVAALIQAAGFTLARRSGFGAMPSEAASRSDVWLGDSIGEMPLYYACAQVALLGGSFAPLGGHNLIEAAACGCPLVMGPHTFNFAEAARLALAAGAALRVADMTAGVEQAVAMLAPATQRQMSAAAQHFAQQHGGAAGRMAERIVALIGEPQSASSPAANAQLR